MAVGTYLGEPPTRANTAPVLVMAAAAGEAYFKVWNAHDVEGIKAMHASASTLTDWDASHGPTNEEVSQGIAGIWKAVPNIKIEIVKVARRGRRSRPPGSRTAPHQPAWWLPRLSSLLPTDRAAPPALLAS